MKDVSKFSFVMLLLGIVFTCSGLFPASAELNVILFGKSENLITDEVVEVKLQSRARSSGPKIFVYRTKDTSKFIYSLRHLELGTPINCKIESNYCYDITDSNVSDFIPTVYFARIYIGATLLVIGVLIFVFRSAIANVNERAENGT